MTRASAKETLANTWIFKQVDSTLALRERALIEAVQNHESALVLPSLLCARHTAYCLPNAAYRTFFGGLDGA